MQTFQTTTIVPEPRIRPVSEKALRQWCAPEVILVVTNLSDEWTILPHAIRQAKQSGAKILLAHVIAPDEMSAMVRRPLHNRSTLQFREAQANLDRMARQLRWLGIICEPRVLTGQIEEEIPSLVSSCHADRVIISFEDNPDLTKARRPTIAEHLLSCLNIPICVISSRVGLKSPNSQPTRNMTLAISLESDCDVPLAFACRLAQEYRAQLDVLHVFGRRFSIDQAQIPTPIDVASRLPVPTWREAKLFCPAEVIIREGDPAEQILKHAASKNDDLIVLCSSGVKRGAPNWRSSVSYRVMMGAQCPVFILEKQDRSADSDSVVSANLKMRPVSSENPFCIAPLEGLM
jgi:nucleotide-binding universal stress UspA family protein